MLLRVFFLSDKQKKIEATVDHKEERFKSLFNITFYCKQARKLSKYVLKERKKVILLKVFETIWTSVRTCQNGHAKPLAFKITNLRRLESGTLYQSTSGHRTIVIFYKKTNIVRAF